MYTFITASQDNYITENSPGHIIQFPHSVYKNYGDDEILELKKFFFDSFSVEAYGVSRILTKFSITSISKSISSGEITNPKFYLRLYEVEGQIESDKVYSLTSFPLSQSWVEGTGKHFDNPKMFLGSSWANYDSGSVWEIDGGSGTSGSRTTGGGVWMTGSGYQASQSFSHESSDIEMDVTDIVDKWLVGSASNHGFLTKFSGSHEDDDKQLDLKFFSKSTNTIYQPKLECRWNDCSYPAPGSLPNSYITMSGELQNHIFIKGLEPSYRESEKVRFRLGCRKKFVKKTFTETMLTSSFIIPKGSGSYSIQDVATSTTIVPFGPYTSMSCDTRGMYFDQWFNNFENGRYYKFIFKLKYNDGTTQIIDNDDEFKVI